MVDSGRAVMAHSSNQGCSPAAEARLHAPRVQFPNKKGARVSGDGVGIGKSFFFLEKISYHSSRFATSEIRHERYCFAQQAIFVDRQAAC